MAILRNRLRLISAARFAGLAALKNVGFSVEPQTSLRLLPTMARETTLLEDRDYLPCKIDHRPGFCGGGGRLARNSQPARSESEGEGYNAARQESPPVPYTP